MTTATRHTKKIKRKYIKTLKALSYLMTLCILQAFKNRDYLIKIYKSDQNNTVAKILDNSSKTLKYLEGVEDFFMCKMSQMCECNETQLQYYLKQLLHSKQIFRNFLKNQRKISDLIIETQISEFNNP